MKNYAGQFHLNKVGVLDDEPGKPEGLIEDYSFEIRGVLHLYREGSDKADCHAEHYLCLFYQNADLLAFCCAILLKNCMQVVELGRDAPPLLAVGLNSVEQDAL